MKKKAILILSGILFILGYSLFKVSQGISAITGAYLGSGMISSKPHTASILLVVIVISMTLYYSRNFIRNVLLRNGR